MQKLGNSLLFYMFRKIPKFTCLLIRFLQWEKREQLFSWECQHILPMLQPIIWWNMSSILYAITTLVWMKLLLNIGNCIWFTTKFLNLYFAVTPKRAFLDLFFPSLPFQAFLIPQIYCISFYLLYVNLCFRHKKLKISKNWRQHCAPSIITEV